MVSSSIYSFNASPEFSADQLSDYMATADARRRTTLIRAAKFPKKTEVEPYSQVRDALGKALSARAYGYKDLALLAALLEGRAHREAGAGRDEVLRSVRAVRAFQETFDHRSLQGAAVGQAPRDLQHDIEGVGVNVSIDRTVSTDIGEQTFAGGVVLVYAFSADRRSMRDRLAAASGLVLWALEDGQMEPLPRLCMAADLANRNIVEASGSHGQLRDRLAASCEEISSRWDSIEPPGDYDGPYWR